MSIPPINGQLPSNNTPRLLKPSANAGTGGITPIPGADKSVWDNVDFVAIYFINAKGKPESRFMTVNEIRNGRIKVEGYVVGIVLGTRKEVGRHLDTDSIIGMGEIIRYIQSGNESSPANAYYNLFRDGETDSFRSYDLEDMADESKKVSLLANSKKLYYWGIPETNPTRKNEPLEPISSSAEFNIEICMGGENVVLQVAHYIPRCVGHIDTNPRTDMDDLNIDYLGAGSDMAWKAPAVARIAKYVYRTEQKFGFNLIDTLEIYSHDIEQCMAEPEVKNGMPRMRIFQKLLLKPWNGLEYVISHELSHLAAKELVIKQGNGMFYYCRYVIGQGNERLFNPGTLKNDMEETNFRSKSFLLFIQDSSFFGVKCGGHPWSNEAEFVASFINTFLYPEILKVKLAKLGESDRRIIVEYYERTLAMLISESSRLEDKGMYNFLLKMQGQLCELFYPK